MNKKWIYRIENITIYTAVGEKMQFDGDLRRRDKGITYLQENEFLVLYFQVSWVLYKTGKFQLNGNEGFKTNQIYIR